MEKIDSLIANAFNIAKEKINSFLEINYNSFQDKLNNLFEIELNELNEKISNVPFYIDSREEKDLIEIFQKIKEELLDEDYISYAQINRIKSKLKRREIEKWENDILDGIQEDTNYIAYIIYDKDSLIQIYDSMKNIEIEKNKNFDEEKIDSIFLEFLVKQFIKNLLELNSEFSFDKCKIDVEFSKRIKSKCIFILSEVIYHYNSKISLFNNLKIILKKSINNRDNNYEIAEFLLIIYFKEIINFILFGIYEKDYTDMIEVYRTELFGRYEIITNPIITRKVKDIIRKNNVTIKQKKLAKYILKYKINRDETELKRQISLLGKIKKFFNSKVKEN